MFKGIVEAVGTVAAVRDGGSTRHIRVLAPSLAEELAPGDSVAVDGACLTVTGHDPEGFGVDVIGTTLARTIAGRYADGTAVNLERALRMGDRIDGHLVQGHIDGIGSLIQSVRDGAYWLMDFVLPVDIARQTVARGSIAINGVSLTVADLLGPETCRVGVIPYTHEHTNLGRLAPGDPVNVEGDLIGKYVGTMLAQREPAGP